jgi:hypothetical protein
MIPKNSIPSIVSVKKGIFKSSLSDKLSCPDVLDKKVDLLFEHAGSKRPKIKMITIVRNFLIY